MARAPSQVALEGAATYTVRRPFRIDGGTLERGASVDGDTARGWPTFRSILSLEWLEPAPDVPAESASAEPEAPFTSVPEPAPPATPRRRR